MDNREKIVSILKNVSKKNSVPEPDESLFDSGFLDSFALPDMVGELETAFQIKIPDADLNPRKFETIERIQSYIENRK
ncbi:MAG TPA: phosphopantetheine-binding protein [Bryobacteraceae bacterium]|nr:phosphopantetheine-binding protein [Bryobacteraceae bacterium]